MKTNIKVTIVDAVDMMVEFWAKKLEEKKRLKIGEPKTTIPEAKATPEQINLFKIELKRLINNQLENKGEVYIKCDYDPHSMLEEAALTSGIEVEMTTFGFKTWTILERGILYLNRENFSVE